MVFSGLKIKLCMRLFLLSNSPMNAPISRHIMRLGKMKNLFANMRSIKSALVAINITAAQILKPITDAPTKRKVALLDVDKLEGVVLTYPIRPIRRAIVGIKMAILDSSRPNM